MFHGPESSPEFVMGCRDVWSGHPRAQGLTVIRKDNTTLFFTDEATISLCLLGRKRKKEKKQDFGEARNGSGYGDDDWTDTQPFPISRFAAALRAAYTDASISWTVKRKSKRAGGQTGRRAGDT